MRRAESRQLSFVFGDSAKGEEQVEVSNVSEAKAWLLPIASDKETTDSAPRQVKVTDALACSANGS